MSIRLTLIAACLLGLGATVPSHAAGTLELQFTDAEHYVDIGHGGYDRDRNIKTLSDYLQTLAAQLPEGQKLKLEVLDVDLAGELRPRAGQEVRVLRGGADWPRIQLRYTLMRSDGSTLKAGEAQISDMNYLQGLQGRTEFYGNLAYEKHMLQTWFKQTLLTP